MAVDPLVLADLAAKLFPHVGATPPLALEARIERALDAAAKLYEHALDKAFEIDSRQAAKNEMMRQARPIVKIETRVA